MVLDFSAGFKQSPTELQYSKPLLLTTPRPSYFNEYACATKHPTI